MQDTRQVTEALAQLYGSDDWLMNLNFWVLMCRSGISSLSRESRLLDCGCAMGHFLHILQAQGFTNVYGIDASPAMVEHAQHLTARPVYCCDALKMSEVLENGTFNALTAMNLQHHLGQEREWAQFTRECRTVIKRGGLLFVREPYPTLLFKVLRWMVDHPLFFRVGLLERRLQSLVEEKALIDYFIKHWPDFFEESLTDNGFEPVKRFMWMGHLIVVARRR
jgi:2-polyprenyl-3-methyl-5-hydroxy-6-metoxy-1,4-benzoquinol methylase